jgi:hypothetical protein
MATVPTIHEEEAKNFQPRSINFPEVVQKKIAEWVDTQIDSLKKRNERLFKNEIPELRRIIDGRPKNKNKSWPFPNCSNVVAQIVGEAVDELAAWVLQLIWITQPLVKFRYPTGKDGKESTEYSDRRQALETFIDNAAFDPRELNLYPFHNKWFTEAAGLGRARLCVAPESRIEAVYTGYKEPEGKSKGGPTFENKTIYEGPKLINLRYEDILVPDPDGPFEDNDPIVRRCTLNVRKIRERVFKGHFKSAEAKIVLDKPDRYGKDEIQKREEQQQGITGESDRTLAEWDIYECYFSWFFNGKKFRLIGWYHPLTKTMLNCVFNFIPDNQVPIIETTIAPDKKGLAQMLRYYQEETSTAKNQRADAITSGILGINTIDPQNKEIDRNLTINPGTFVVAKAGTFQHFDMANPAFAGLSLQNEEALAGQAKRRSGVGPPIMGAGAGSANKKGQFGSMGTLAVMQAGNSRDAHRTSGFRHSSVRLFSLLTDFYGFMGLGDSELVKQALDDYLQRKLRIPVRAADASMNKEVTKQNEIILNQAYAAYIKQQSSMIQAYFNPQLPPEYKKWMKAIISGNARMFRQILIDFQLTDNPMEFVPDIELPEVEEQKPNAAPAGQQPPGLAQVASILQGQRGGGNAPGGTPVPNAPGGLTGQGGI